MPVISPTTDPERRLLPSALRHVRRHGLALALAAAGFALGLMAFRVPRSFALWVAIPAVLLIAFALLIYSITPRLDCPSCGEWTEDLGEHCPSCGESGLEVDRWRGTICSACKRVLGKYQSRTYRIRFCTHCGVLLNRRGI
jgi:hypothetical protein